MLLTIYNNVQIQIDEEDKERILAQLEDGCNWYFSTKTGQVLGWCVFHGKVKEKIALSRVIMRCYDKHLDVDHINNDRYDLRKQSLRVCSHQENCFNTRKHSNNTSGYKGVYFRKDRNVWYSRIRTKIGRINIGVFDTAEDAAKAYDVEALKWHGEFAVLNFPKDSNQNDKS